MVSDKTLLEMKEYYRKRAAEYDEWWYRQGRYDHGLEIKANIRETETFFIYGIGTKL